VGKEDVYDHIFIVRLRLDGRGDHGRGLVGSIERVGSGEKLYFSDTGSIERFICEQTGSRQPVPIPRWRSLWRSLLMKLLHGI
jgi:hypothetical protein